MATSPASQTPNTDLYIDDYSPLTRELLSDCTLCPRNCHVNRLAGEKGFCGQVAHITAARASLHMWEEPCNSGTSGSGTVIFCGCNLKCVFCQIRNIALGNVVSKTPSSNRLAKGFASLSAPIHTVTVGRAVSLKTLVSIFMSLQEKGANNINLVTPSHFVPQICDALRYARSHGLSVPVVYNTSSYESVDTLKLLDGLVDIYLPDIKYYSDELSLRYSYAKDYFPRASAAIAEMFRQVGTPVFHLSPDPVNAAPQTLMKKGIIVRHLILPGQTKDSKRILRYLHNTYGNDIYISIMNQYTPLPHVADIPELNRKVTSEEYNRVLDFALRIGIENGFLQEGEAASESFIPEFDGEGL